MSISTLFLTEKREHRMYIGGEWVAATDNKWHPVVDPAMLAPLGEVPYSGAVEARSAVDAAAHAFPAWSALSGRERSRFLLRLGELMRRQSNDIAEIITAEAGKPLQQARDEARSSAAYITWYGEEAKRAYGTIVPSAQREKRIWVVQRPVGVVATITPWNFPLGLMVRKVAAALAAGCTVVVKPALETPLVSFAFANLCAEVGLPPGVVNIVTGDPEIISNTWLDDARVRCISFTGSTTVGRLLARKAAERLQRVSLELGGCAPYIVFSDTNIDLAVTGLFQSKIRNAGQVCGAPNRLYIQSDIYADFVTRLTAMIDKVQVGNGCHPQCQMGPLINEKGFRKVERMVDEAQAQGAKVHTGGSWIGEPKTRTGWFWRPQILTNVSEECVLVQQEAFGPVLPVLVFDHEHDVLARANHSPYGLGAYVYTRDLTRAIRMAEALDAGIVGVNDALPAAVEAPFGGMKESGYGREGGAEGLAEFLEEKTISLQLI